MARQHFTVLGELPGETRVLTNLLYPQTALGAKNKVVDCSFSHAVTKDCHNLRILKSCEAESSNIIANNSYYFTQGIISFCADEEDGEVMNLWDYLIPSGPHDGHSRRPRHDKPQNRNVYLTLSSTHQTLPVGYVHRDCGYSDVDSGEYVHLSDCFTLGYPLKLVEHRIGISHSFGYELDLP